MDVVEDFGYGPCAELSDFEWIPTVKMETRHPVECYLGSPYVIGQTIIFFAL